MGKAAKAPERWRNSILRYGEEAPDQLLAHPLNFRIHPRPQQLALEGAINDLGWLTPVIVNEASGHVIDGHLRVELAISRGEASVPVAYVSLTEAQEAEALATFDPIGAMAVTDKAKLDELLREVSSGDAAVQAMLAELARQSGLDYGKPEPAEDPGPQIDRAEELRVKWQAETGQLWIIPSKSVPGKAHRLLCGDSTKAEDVARLMAGEKAHLLLTDPPYNVGVSYGRNVNDSLPEADYEIFTRQWFGEWRGRSGRQIVTPGCQNLGHWMRWFQPYHVAPWTKTNALTNGLTSRFWCWEPITFFGEPDEWSWEGILFYGEGWQRKRANDVFNYPIGSQKEVAGHPCPKPLAMWEDIVEHFTKPGELLIDAFVGSGTGLVAAERKGRLCYGQELEAKYVAATLERLSGMGLEPRLVNASSVQPEEGGAAPTVGLREVAS